MGRTALFSRNRPGGVFTIVDIEEHPGEVYFVDSSAAGAGATVGHGGDPDKPWSSLSYAFSSDVPVAGDTIYVMPGHTETISAAGGITADIAGVKVIGLGWGAARPTFTFSATDSTFLVSAASVVLKNLRVLSSVAELVQMFSVSGANVTLDAVDHIAAGASTTIQFLKTTAAGDYLTIKNCRHYMNTAPAATSIWIELVGSDYSLIENNITMLTLRNHAGVRTLAATGTACLGLTVKGNVFDQRGGTTQDYVVNMVASTTGLYVNNRSFGDVGTLAGSIELASMASSESYQATTVNKSGILDPVVA